MAPKKNKARRASKTLTVKHSKVSKRKMKAARNECCPIIYTSCHPTFKYKTETVVGDDTAYDKKVKVQTGTKCSVKLGTRSMGKNLSVEAKNKKVEELSAMLEAKRCKALTESEQDRKAKKLAARAARAAKKVDSSWWGL